MGSPAGGGYSTVTDLWRLDQALRSGVLVRPQTAELLTTGKVAPPFDTDERYGYGFQEERYLGTRISGHGGGFPGVSSKLYTFSDSVAPSVQWECHLRSWRYCRHGCEAAGGR